MKTASAALAAMVLATAMSAAHAQPFSGPFSGSGLLARLDANKDGQITKEETAAARERMFERFWRGDRSRTSRGSGLGLAIARGLVEAHGGRIWAEDREGGGARVCFTLPAG